jgi:hypothetical protein
MITGTTKTLDGARRFASTAQTTSEIGMSFFLLLGFSDSALKAHLEKKSEPPGKWERSHDLTDLFDKASARARADRWCCRLRARAIPVSQGFRVSIPGEGGHR